MRQARQKLCVHMRSAIQGCMKYTRLPLYRSLQEHVILLQEAQQRSYVACGSVDGQLYKHWRIPSRHHVCTSAFSEIVKERVNIQNCLARCRLRPVLRLPKPCGCLPNGANQQPVRMHITPQGVNQLPLEAIQLTGTLSRATSPTSFETSFPICADCQLHAVCIICSAQHATRTITKAVDVSLFEPTNTQGSRFKQRPQGTSLLGGAALKDALHLGRALLSACY
jgi:hypothetical protein